MADSPPTEAGRGFLFITGAKLWFLVTATVTSLAFPRLFGDEVIFGQYRVVSGLLNVLTMVVITATVQAVSRLASEAGAHVGRVRRLAFGVQAALFGPVILALALGADFVADDLLNDPELALPIRVSSIVVAAYSAYAVLIGALNGTRRFGRQAALDATFSTLKTGLTVAAVLASGSVAWVFGGFATAAVLVLLLAIPVSRPRAEDLAGSGAPGAGHLLSYLLPLAGLALVLNLLLQADVLFLKSDFGSRFGPEAGSAAAGVFGAAKNAALLPYQAVISLAFVVFPLVSRSSSEGDRAATEAAAGGAIRLAAVLSFAAVVVFGAAPGELLRILYGDAYAPAAPAFLILLAASALLAVTYVANAVLASSGRPLLAFAGGLSAFGTQFVILAAFLPGAAESSEAGRLGALAMLAGSVAWACVALGALAWLFPASRWKATAALSAVAAVVAVGACGIAGEDVPWMLRFMLGVGVFGIVLAVTRAVPLADVKAALGAVKGKRR